MPKIKHTSRRAFLNYGNNSMNRIFSYFSEAKAELARVNWPKPKHATQLTLAVGLFSLAFAVLIGALDFVFTTILQKVILKG